MATVGHNISDVNSTHYTRQHTVIVASTALSTVPVSIGQGV